MADMFDGKAIILMGPRQAGKTTAVRQLLTSINKPYLTLEADDPAVQARLRGATTADLRAMVSGFDIIFIDEAQRLENAGLTLKLFTDQIKEVQVIATGSSSFELADRIKEPLTGRKYEYTFLPLSFAEMAAHHGRLQEASLIDHRMVWGYYPEVVTRPDRADRILKEIAGSYLYRDLLALESMRKAPLLERLTGLLAAQIGQEVRTGNLAKELGVKSETVDHYIDLLERAFILFRLPTLCRNHSSEIKKGRKIYFVDNGIRNAVLGNLTPFENRSAADRGALFENLMVAERYKLLLHRQLTPRRYFWRTVAQQEIDYLEEHLPGRLRAYEFKYAEQKASFSKTFLQSYPEATGAGIVNKLNAEFFLTEV